MKNSKQDIAPVTARPDLYDAVDNEGTPQGVYFPDADLRSEFRELQNVEHVEVAATKTGRLLLVLTTKREVTNEIQNSSDAITDFIGDDAS